MRSLSSIAVVSLFLLGMSVGTSQSAEAQPRAAILTEVSGGVNVERASGGTVDASWGMQLFQGDVVRTGAGGSATLLFSDNNLVSLGNSASMTVSSSSGQGRAVPTQQYADVSDLTLHRAGQGEIAALGGLRSGARASSVVALTPRNSRVLDRAPSFAWHASDEFEEYVVRVLDASGAVWSETVTENEVQYPESAPALAPGTEYFWQVTGVRMLDEIPSELVSFVVLDETTRETVAREATEIEAMFDGQADASSRDYLLGAMYAREGLMTEAVAAFSRIARRHPESPVAHEILGKLYYDMGMKDEAIEALKAALDSER